MKLSTKDQINLEIQVRQNIKLSRNKREEIQKNVQHWICKSDHIVNNRDCENEPESKSANIIKYKSSRQTIVNCLRNAKNNNGSFIWNELPEELLHQCKSAIVDIKFCIDSADFGSQQLIQCSKSLSDIVFHYHFYKLHDEMSQNGFEDDLPATFHTVLPAKCYDSLWESLIFDTDIKAKLINYVRASLMFAKHKVNQSIITWNKMILLHGPPGTGKTSLCKALAQKFAIRACDQYRDFQLIEINAHSLFSKWFSESGKLVLKLFDGIREFAEDNEHLVFVLIDEVESLAYDRQRVNSADPTDAMRVVNALLTQIDSIKRFPNVIIFASSNVPDAMDGAFVDRVDIKQFIGLPSNCAVYKILSHCICELINNGIIIEQNSCQSNQNNIKMTQIHEFYAHSLLSYSQALHYELIMGNDFQSDHLTENVSNSKKTCNDNTIINSSISDKKPFKNSQSNSSTFSSSSSSSYVFLDLQSTNQCDEKYDSETVENSIRLLRFSRRCVSFSGRTLRKLPFLAIALFCDCKVGLSLTLPEFFHSLERAIDKQLQDNKRFEK